MKLCVFQGTFNPIHNVHLAMAKYIKDYFDFDTILFIPAYKPPHKEVDEEFSNQRFQMVKMAISGESFFNISNIEFQNERFSYTYLTIQELYRRYKIDGQISFIIGSDAFKEIQSWYEANKLKKLVNFIVFPREDHFNPECLNHLKARGFNFTVAGMKFQDISSTEIRTKLQEGHSVMNYLPPCVTEYISKNGLYK
jgi:nicotinate-nucleotide adenylyltransferase